MNRDQKTDVVQALNETFSKAKFAVVADYRGLKVTELEKLRKNLRRKKCALRRKNKAQKSWWMMMD